MKFEIQIGNQAFLKDGGEEFGAVRQLLPNGDLVVYVENSGDHTIPHAAIEAAHSGKVIVHADKLSPELRKAINHAHDAEQKGL